MQHVFFERFEKEEGNQHAVIQGGVRSEAFEGKLLKPKVFQPPMGQFILPGMYALLGEISEGVLGGEAADNTDAAQAGYQPVYRLVQVQPADVSQRTMADTQRQAERLLSVFWDTRE